MVEFKFACPHCATQIACEIGYTGWQINCPACRQVLVVPPPGTAAGGAASPPPAQSPMGALSNQPQQSALALAALLVSIFGLPGIICGHLALARIGKNPRLTGRGLALTGLFIGYFSFALTVVVVIVGLNGGLKLTRENASNETPTSSVSSATGESPAAVAEPKETVNTLPSIVWTDNFESGLANWTAVPDGNALASSSTKNHTANGTTSAKVSGSRDKMFRDVGPAVTGHAKVSFWIYDSDQLRAYGEVRDYAGGGYGNGVLHQILAIGRYSIGFGTGKGALADEKVDATRYQGRVVAGQNSGWFNLNAPGAPARTTGWHKFEIEREKDGTTVNFYVDDVLGRKITDTTRSKWSTVAIGSLGADKVMSGDAWFDDIKIERLATQAGAVASSKKSAAPKRRSVK